MTQVTYRPSWITNDFFEEGNDVFCKVFNVEVTNEKGKQDVVMEIVSKRHHCRFSVWGANMKTMIDKFGSDTDNWKGNEIIIHRSRSNDKTIKTIVIP